MPYSDIQKALEKAEIEKKSYQKNLVGKTFAYVYINKQNNNLILKEVQFRTENYLHLTGLDYKNVQYDKRVNGINRSTGADEFYNRLGTDNTLIKDVSFITEATPVKTAETFRNTQKKLQNLSQLVNIAKKADYIGNYRDNKMFDLFISRNKEVVAMVKKGTIYVPISSRNGEVNKFTKDKNMVLAIFSKENNQKKYIIEYLNKNINLSNNLIFNLDIIDKFDFYSFLPDKNKLNQKQLDKLVEIYTTSVKYKISALLQDVAVLRDKAFSSEPDMNEYINATKIFRQNIDNKEMLSMAIAILKKDFEECPSADNKDLINDEINKLSELFPTSDGLVHIVKFENELPKGQAQGNALAVPLPKVAAPQPPNIFDKFRNIAQDIIKDFKKLLSEEPPKKNKTVSKTPQNKTKSSKAAQKKEPVKKTVEKIQAEKEQEPEQKKARFCKADLKSEKYAPRSQKKDRSVSRKRNDLEH